MSASGSAAERFTAWVTRFGDAWEARSAGALDALFTVGATFQPTPFAPLVRGRRQIREWFAVSFAGRAPGSFSAQILGAGATYGVAHWRYAGPDFAVDGILLAALDDRGRCTSLRQWWHERTGPLQ